MLLRQEPELILLWPDEPLCSESSAACTARLACIAANVDSTGRYAAEMKAAPRQHGRAAAGEELTL